MPDRLLARFHRDTLEVQANQRIARIIGDSTGETSATHRDFEDPTIGNEHHCRGVPIQVRGVSGAIRGTRPGERLP